MASAARFRDISRLQVSVTVTEEVLVDAYLMLRDPAGRSWLSDGRRLVALGEDPPLALAKGLPLGKGVQRAILELPLPPGAERPAGDWAWNLLFTESGTERIISEASAVFRVRSEAGWPDTTMTESEPVSAQP